MNVDKEQQQRIKVSMSSGASQKTVDSSQVEKACYSWHKWREWVQTKNINLIKLFNYYLGDERVDAGDTITDEENEFILREIFIDAINAGAIEFSKEVDPEDFSFKLQLPQYLTVRYTPNGGKRTEEITIYFPSTWIRNYGLDDICYLEGLLYELYEASRYIV